MGSKKIGILLAFLGFWFLNSLQLSMATHGHGVHHYNFVLKETNFTRLCSTKSMLTVNGSFPGPVIRVHRGERVFVNVHNQGLYGVTIHWHGVKQPRNPWSDGPENITQCPIQPGTNFTYEVILSDEEGTLWWHAHSDWSRATVHGAFVILPPRGKSYPFTKPDSEQIIVLASWFKGDVKKIIDTALEAGGNPNISDAYTINGQPGDLYNCSSNSTFRMKVEYGKTYLLRIINAVMNEEQFFAIANHNLTVVGQDAAYLKPFTTSYLMITPGQAMDVVFTANQSPSHYYMVSTPFFDSVVPFNNSTTTAIVEYHGSYTPPSTPSFPSVPDYDDEDAASNFTSHVRSLASEEYPIDVPKKINTRIYITVSVNQLPCPAKNCSGAFGDRQSASLNNISFMTPSVDILQAYYSDVEGVFTKNFPNKPSLFNYTGDTNVTIYTSQGTRVRVIKYGASVEIVFQGTNIGAAESHPMHLHGFSFYLVGTGSGNFNKTSDQKYYNLVDPPLLNTINLPKNGWAAIRFKADNPGVWFMHCHLERHASWGMDTVLIVKNGHTRESRIRRPPAYMPPCSSS